jgi:hypothetical protein
VPMLGAMTSHLNPIGSNCNKFREIQCTHVELAARGPAHDYAAVNSTGSAAGERNATPLMLGYGAVGSKRRSGSRSSRALIATVVSIRASGMPRHTCGPAPNVRRLSSVFGDCQCYLCKNSKYGGDSPRRFLHQGRCEARSTALMQKSRQESWNSQRRPCHPGRLPCGSWSRHQRNAS